MEPSSDPTVPVHPTLRDPVNSVDPRAKTLWRMMVGSSILGVVFTISGLWLAYTFDLTSGAAIIIVAGGAFFLMLLAEQVRKRVFLKHHRT